MKIHNTLKILITCALLILCPVTARGAESAMAEGEVRKVDMDAKKITIRHGPIPALNMPPMTMVFQVRDPALLDAAKAGDKIRFSAEQDRGAFVVNRIERAE